MTGEELRKHCYAMGYSDGEVDAFYDGYQQGRADAIDEAKDEIVHHLNDYALQEAPIYQDDIANQRPVYLAIKNCINGVIEIAEQVKEQEKNEQIC